jgi:hypothetical protein
LAEHGTCEEKRDAILYEGRVIAPWLLDVTN